jgi:NADH:ubiquinone oxidoreductase subunit 2 (subunit N)
MAWAKPGFSYVLASLSTQPIKEISEKWAGYQDHADYGHLLFDLRLFCYRVTPLGGFFSKLLVIMGTIQANQIWIAALALFTAI